MISYPALGSNGRLGNQLFQYAFLRTQAERLGVGFYCPSWIGDQVFNLGDSGSRKPASEGIIHLYYEKFFQNYDRTKIKLLDHTEVLGWFESEKNFDSGGAKKWYSFREDQVASVQRKYHAIDFSKSVGMHFRFGDKSNEYKAIFYCPRKSYYDRCLSEVAEGKKVLVFSDEIEKAKKFLMPFEHDYVFIEGNQDWEDLYLMSRCHDMICGASTLSWWGGWLNPNPGKKVYFPKEGLGRPWGLLRNRDLVPSSWIQVRALRPVIDSYPVVGFPRYKKIRWFTRMKTDRFLKAWRLKMSRHEQG